MELQKTSVSIFQLLQAKNKAPVSQISGDTKMKGHLRNTTNNIKSENSVLKSQK